MAESAWIATVWPIASADGSAFARRLAAREPSPPFSGQQVGHRQHFDAGVLTEHRGHRPFLQQQAAGQGVGAEAALGGVDLHLFVRQRRPGDAAASLLQPLAVVRFHPHRGVHAEAVDVGAQWLIFDEARHLRNDLLEDPRRLTR